MLEKKKFDSKDFDTRDWIKEMVIKGVKEGNLKQYFSGIDKNYRIQERDTYDKTVTDTYYLIVSGLYPVYLKYGYDLDKETRKVLEEMIDGGDSREYAQVYWYIWNELHLRDNYTNLPFVVVDKELIYKMKGADEYSKMKSLEKNEAFADPEAYFCEEYINGGRKGYVQKVYNNEDNIKSIVKKGIEEGELKEVIAGRNETYRIEPKSYSAVAHTDILRMIVNGLFALYCEGMKDIKNITRKSLEEMIDADNPHDLYQVFSYAHTELFLMEKYSNLPFVVMDIDLVEKLKNKRAEMKDALQAFDIDGLSAWEITGNMERNYDAFSKTEEFFKEYF